MQNLPQFLNRHDVGRIRLRLRRVLRAPSGQRAPEQTTSSGDAGRYQPLRWRAEPSGHIGLRKAEAGETPLSAEEIKHGRHIGAIL